MKKALAKAGAAVAITGSVREYRSKNRLAFSGFGSVATAFQMFGGTCSLWAKSAATNPDVLDNAVFRNRSNLHEFRLHHVQPGCSVFTTIILFLTSGNGDSRLLKFGFRTGGLKLVFGPTCEKRNMMARHIAMLAVAVAGLSFSGFAHGSNINFGAGTNIAGPADVSLSGTLVKAYSFGAAGTLQINGVSFADFDSQALDTKTGLGNVQPNTYGTNGQSGDYATMMSNGDWNDGGSSSITLNGLTSGHSYILQTWVNDSRLCCGDRTNIYSGDAPGTDGVALFDGATNNGQYVIGTFVASGSSQILNIDLNPGSTNNNQINGLQLRDTTNVPEPVSLGFLGAGALGLLLRRHRI